MIKKLILISVTFSLLSCKTNKKESKDEKVKIDTTIIEGKALKKSSEIQNKVAVVIVKNKSDYSENFIDSLTKMSRFREFELSDNFMIVNKKDTVYFPDRPKINKRVILTAKKEELAIALSIKRKNQVLIEYKIEMVEFGKASFNTKGVAEIRPSFFLKPQYDTNNITGTVYSSTSFRDDRGECHNEIRLGYGNKMKFLLGRIVKNCNGKIRDINLEDYSVLIEK